MTFASERLLKKSGVTCITCNKKNLPCFGVGYDFYPTCWLFSISLWTDPFFWFPEQRTLASLDCNQVEKSTSKAEPISCENRSLLMDLSGALSMLAQYSIMASLNLDRAGQRKHSIVAWLKKHYWGHTYLIVQNHIEYNYWVQKEGYFLHHQSIFNSVRSKGLLYCPVTCTAYLLKRPTSYCRVWPSPASGGWCWELLWGVAPFCKLRKTLGQCTSISTRHSVQCIKLHINVGICLSFDV